MRKQQMRKYASYKGIKIYKDNYILTSETNMFKLQLTGNNCNYKVTSVINKL